KLYLFGSATRDELTDESDLDFLVEFDSPSIPGYADRLLRAHGGPRGALLPARRPHRRFDKSQSVRPSLGGAKPRLALCGLTGAPDQYLLWDILTTEIPVLQR